MGIFKSAFPLKFCIDWCKIWLVTYLFQVLQPSTGLRKIFWKFAGVGNSAEECIRVGDLLLHRHELSCTWEQFLSFCDRECYYPSTRTENKGLLALFSVRQGRWVYLFSEMTYIVSGGTLNPTHSSLTHLIDWGLSSPAQCTLYGNPRTVDGNSWKRLQIAIDVLT